MSDQRSKDPLHGVTLKAILEELVARYGWKEMAAKIRINCFSQDPNMKSSLTFLRKTPWARCKVEQLYLISINGKLSQGTKPKSSKSPGWKAPGVKPPEANMKRTKANSPWDSTASTKINVWTGKPLEDGEER